MRNRLSNKELFFLSFLFSYCLVFSFFTLQAIFVFKDFHPRMIIAPFVVATLFGYLIGKILVLRKKLSFREQLFQSIADNAKEFSYVRKLDGEYEFVSQAVETITGYAQEDFYREKNFFSKLIAPEHQKRWSEHLEHIETDKQHEELEFKIIKRDGGEAWISHRCSALFDENNQKIGIKSVNLDITQKKIDDMNILRLSKIDTLTSLPNRESTLEKIDELLSQKVPLSVIQIDINRFKKINDTLGHHYGDIVLREIAEKLQKRLGFVDFIGRLGGDEFLLIVKNPAENIDLFLSRLLKVFEEECSVGEHTFYLSASIGVASFPENSDNKESLLAYADAALQQAKSASSENIVFYKEIQKKYSYEDFLLEKELRMAINEGKLSIALQPKFSISKGSIDSFEALVRWSGHSPAEFIPVAEETGLIKKITKFVIDAIFKLSKEWRKRGVEYKISINISVIDFMSDSLIDYIDKKSLEHGIDPSWFELELTESIFLESSKKIDQSINALINRGFTIALDDFGTGYSSLSYITKFPITTLKIDKLFVDNLTIDYDKNYPLMRSIVAIASNLNMDMVVEGVETKEQLDIVSALGCDIIQGYYFYKPLSLEEVAKIL